MRKKQNEQMIWLNELKTNGDYVMVLQRGDSLYIEWLPKLIHLSLCSLINFSHSYPPQPPKTLVTATLVSSSDTNIILISQMKKIMWCLPFNTWLMSYNTMSSISIHVFFFSIHVFPNDSIWLILRMNSILLNICTTISIHSSIYRHLHYFHVLTMMKNATISMGLQMSLQRVDFIFLA